MWNVTGTTDIQRYIETHSDKNKLMNLYKWTIFPGEDLTSGKWKVRRRSQQSSKEPQNDMFMES